MEQLVARQVHILKVVGSSPTPAPSYLPFVQPDRTRGYGPRNKGSNPLWETKGEVLIILKKRLSVHNNEEVVTLGKIIGSLHSLI